MQLYSNMDQDREIFIFILLRSGHGDEQCHEGVEQKHRIQAEQLPILHDKRIEKSLVGPHHESQRSSC